MDAGQVAAFDAMLPAMSQFKRVFGRDPNADFIAELYVVREFGLELPAARNEQGADALGPDGRRYQVKLRAAGTLNVDANNFEFDDIVLVNLTEDYRLAGLWRLTREKAQAIFVERGKYRKWQATQAKFKQCAERVR